MPQTIIVPAIMSGGAGTRLWPASTDARPKQFLALFGKRTLFQETLLRVTGAHGDIVFAPPVILANARHADLIDTQLAEIGVAPAAIALEPVGRNTAATAVLAAAIAQESAADALVLLLPADHLIADRVAFLDAVARAAPAARTRIATFGVAPSRPETGYGYIKAGAPIGAGIHAIDAFHEKPDARTAERFLAAGHYSWNAGMFLFAPEVLLEEFRHAAPIRDQALAALAQSQRTGARITLPRAQFAAIEAQPLDKAVMEQTARGAVAPCDIGWADVGSWQEIWRLSEKDSAGNAVTGDAALIESGGNLIRSDGPRIAIAGIHDLVVIASRDTILIVPRDRAQDVKALREKANE